VAPRFEEETNIKAQSPRKARPYCDFERYDITAFGSTWKGIPEAARRNFLLAAYFAHEILSFKLGGPELKLFFRLHSTTSWTHKRRSGTLSGMKSCKFFPLIMTIAFCFFALNAQQQEGSKPLRILVIGAHPDDPESVGGTMAKFIAQGHKVRLVSMTNGNAGHQEIGGAPLAKRRYKEAQCAGAAIGAEYVVLDNDDGKLMPTLENREQVIAQIRGFQADIVITHRPNDYHPDHRNTGLLVRDAAYMVTVPNIVASVPHLRKNPLFMYMQDRFTKPLPFEPDLVVSIDDVVEKKIDMLHCHESQMYEWLPYNMGILDQVPEDVSKRRDWLGTQWKPYSTGPASTYRKELVELYGQEKGSAVNFAEAFEVSEYGWQPSPEELKEMFSFFD
jgi:LmbE family N-acetylglucosaminyl deacetylase